MIISIFFLSVSLTLFSTQEDKNLICHPLDPANIQRLTQIYIEGIHEDREMVAVAWRETANALRNYLREGGFHWDEPFRVFFYFFMSPDGRIDQLHYSILGEPFDGEMKEKFLALLEEFARMWKFPVGADQPFSQCGTIQLDL